MKKLLVNFFRNKFVKDISTYLWFIGMGLYLGRISHSIPDGYFMILLGIFLIPRTICLSSDIQKKANSKEAVR
ncbi:hypothetical protein AAEX28_14370 [Lentisphaerota bacterium WC36G]|nr:hypothetical protein LJT99_01125 [Lentisphaerae bacterium WC36]